MIVGPDILLDDCVSCGADIERRLASALADAYGDKYCCVGGWNGMGIGERRCG